MDFGGDDDDCPFNDLSSGYDSPAALPPPPPAPPVGGDIAFGTPQEDGDDFFSSLGAVEESSTANPAEQHFVHQHQAVQQNNPEIVSDSVGTEVPDAGIGATDQINDWGEQDDFLQEDSPSSNNVGTEGQQYQQISQVNGNDIIPPNEVPASTLPMSARSSVTSHSHPASPVTQQQQPFLPPQTTTAQSGCPTYNGHSQQSPMSSPTDASPCYEAHQSVTAAAAAPTTIAAVDSRPEVHQPDNASRDRVNGGPSAKHVSQHAPVKPQSLEHNPFEDEEGEAEFFLESATEDEFSLSADASLGEPNHHVFPISNKPQHHQQQQQHVIPEPVPPPVVHAVEQHASNAQMFTSAPADSAVHNDQQPMIHASRQQGGEYQNNQPEMAPHPSLDKQHPTHPSALHVDQLSQQGHDPTQQQSSYHHQLQHHQNHQQEHGQHHQFMQEVSPYSQDSGMKAPPPTPYVPTPASTTRHQQEPPVNVSHPPQPKQSIPLPVQSPPEVSDPRPSPGAFTPGAAVPPAAMQRANTHSFEPQQQSGSWDQQPPLPPQQSTPSNFNARSGSELANANSGGVQQPPRASAPRVVGTPPSMAHRSVSENPGAYVPFQPKIGGGMGAVSRVVPGERSTSTFSATHRQLSNTSVGGSSGVSAPHQQQPQTPQNPPIPFKRSPCIAVGFGGRLFTSFAQPNQTGISSVKIATVLSVEGPGVLPTELGKGYEKELSALPGCVTLQTKHDHILATCEKLSSQSGGKSSLLSKILSYLACEKSMFDWENGGRVQLQKFFEECKGTQGAANTISPFLETAPLSFGQEEAVATIQSLIEQGERLEAVRCALHYKMYEHALVIAMMCNQETYMEVVQTWIQEQLHPASTLAQAYHMFNEIPFNAEPIVDIHRQQTEYGAPAMFSDPSQWASHITMILANWSRSSAETLVQWGDVLCQSGNYDAGHACYITAQLSPIGNNPQLVEALKNKYTLLGGVYRRDLCRSAYISPTAVFQTELLEFFRQKDNPKYVRPQLMPFRVVLAHFLMEMGMTQAATTYLDAVSKLLPVVKKGNEGSVMRNLAEVVHMAKHQLECRQKGTSTVRSNGGGWWPFGGGGGSQKQPEKTVRSSTPTAVNPTPSLVGSVKDRAASVMPTSSFSAAAAKASSAAPSATATPEDTSTTSSKQQTKESSLERSKSQGWGSWLKFGRGSSAKREDSKPNEEKEAKPMIIDTQSTPKFDPVTGRYLFDETEEEKKIKAQVAAGPPKMPMRAPSDQQPMPSPSAHPPPGGAPPPSQYPMPPGAPTLGGPPPPPGMGGPHHKPQQRPQYVDMFNS